MEFFEAGSHIEADPAQVWVVLIDAGHWSDWDSGVTGVTGTVAEGQKITIRSEASPGRAFPVTVKSFEPPTRLVLSGGMPLGLFTGVRTYSLTPDGTGTRFHLREEYTGALLSMMWKRIPDLDPSFRQFADGLKRRVEGS